MKNLPYFFLITLLGIHASCFKGLNCKQPIYSFEAFYKAYPDKDSIKVNDTIWVELTTPVKLKDFETEQVIDYSGAENFGPSIQYIELIGGDLYNPGGIAAANSFENHLIWGTPVSFDKPDKVRSFRCIEENGSYKFKVGIIPKKKGAFIIAPGNAANVFRKNDKCTKAGFNLTFKNTDQHLYLYEQNRPGYVPSGYEREHMYCFVVY